MELPPDVDKRIERLAQQAADSIANHCPPDVTLYHYGILTIEEALAELARSLYRPEPQDAAAGILEGIMGRLERLEREREYRREQEAGDDW